MSKKIVKNGWVYNYDVSNEYRRKYDCELTDVRYVLGEQFDTDKQNVLICIGINPSMAMPNFLDPTLRRVQDYAKRSGEYRAWYMLNVYPQRATNPNHGYGPYLRHRDSFAQSCSHRKIVVYH